MDQRLVKQYFAGCLRHLIASHHLHEFIEINSSRSVSINFLDDAIQIRARKLVVEGAQNFFQGGGGDVTVAFTIVETESFLQLSGNINSH